MKVIERNDRIIESALYGTRFLVVGITEGEEWSRIMSADEIFAKMDMADCCEEAIDIWKINGYGEALTCCQFLGKWVAGGAEEPQRMEIRSENGIEAIGYGEEH